MDWISKLEKKYRRYAIKDLIKYLVIGAVIVFAVAHLDRTGTIYHLLTLDRATILQGQIWRLVTFIFIPETLDALFIIFVLYLFYMFGSSLERLWGSFRLNLYYAIGMLTAIIAAFISKSGMGSALYLNLSIFLAFAYLYPNFKLLIFFIIPVKVKYLALFELLFVAYSIIVHPWYIKIAAILSFSNFFIFFGKDIYHARILPKLRPVIKERRKKKVMAARPKLSKNAVFNYKCRECGRTSKDHPELKFGYCIICGSDYEYCQDHLGNHTHVN